MRAQRAGKEGGKNNWVGSWHHPSGRRSRKGDGEIGGWLSPPPWTHRLALRGEDLNRNALRWDERFRLPGQFSDHDIKNRREEQAEAGDTQHPKENGGTEGLTHLGARPLADDQRHHAENE